MAKRGSEICPIDLTDDDSPPPNLKKSKYRKDTIRCDRRDDTRPPCTRPMGNVTTKELECKPEEKNVHTPDSGRYVTREENAALLSRLKDLEKRICLLQGSLEKVAQVFIGANIGGAHENRCESDHTSSGVLKKKPRKSRKAPTNTDLSPVLANVADSDALPNHGYAGVIRENHLMTTSSEVPSNIGFVANSGGNHEEVNSIFPITSHPTNISNLSPEKSHEKFVKSPEFMYTQRDAAPGANVSEVEVEELNLEDIKKDLRKDIISLSPQLPVKEEIKLWRDDQGRVIIPLYCNAKRVNKTSSIAAVAGTYLTDELHNEYRFTSDRSLKDVKIEAEIRAAMFGIETIKQIFNGSLDSVCVMIISSSPRLVQAMKYQRLYPKFFSCSCEVRDCMHCESRWDTNNPLGQSHSDVLPNLMIAMKPFKVHWCTNENISEEEKKIVDEYKTLVEAELTQFISSERRKTRDVLAIID